MSMSDELLDAIRDRAMAATPGPMRIGERANLGTGACHPVHSTAMQPDGINRYMRDAFFSCRADAEFYAIARTDVLLLLAEIDALRQRAGEAQS